MLRALGVAVVVSTLPDPRWWHEDSLGSPRSCAQVEPGRAVRLPFRLQWYFVGVLGIVMQKYHINKALVNIICAPCLIGNLHCQGCKEVSAIVKINFCP